MSFIDPLSPKQPDPGASPDPHAQPEAVEGNVSERRHEPLPQPAAPQSAPLPSVSPELMPHNQQDTDGFAVPVPRPNAPQPNLVPEPSRGRESDPERVAPNGTANSQLSPNPVDQYLPSKPAPEADPLHNPNLP